MSTTAPLKNPALRILGWILLSGLAAGLAACVIAYGIAGKWFVSWQALPALPEKAQSIAGATIRSVDVLTLSGSLFRCEPRAENRCWIPVEAPETETDQGCEAFDQSRPLGNVVEQRLVCRIYADGDDTVIYALRGDGRVYSWRAGGSGYESLLLVIIPAACAPLGMVFGLVVGLIRNRQRHRAPAG